MIAAAAIVALLLSPGSSTLCPQANTQLELNQCAAGEAKRADAALNASYQDVLNVMRSYHVAISPMTRAETAWIDMRDKSCGFIAAQYEGGSIQPMEESLCLASLSHARAVRLDAYRTTLSKNELRPLQRVDATVDRSLNSAYQAVRRSAAHGTDSKLEDAEIAWIRYRDRACPIEGGSCVTDLENERVTFLKQALPEQQQ